MGETGTLTVVSVNGPDVEALNSERSPGRCVQITIHDTGHGMNEETRRHAFEPFFTDRPDGSGTGLGLAMVYGTISNHGGEVEIQSAVGQGCTVTITLPAAPSAAEPSEDAKPTTGPASGTVLLVDDEPSVIRIGKLILERIGYATLTAETGIAALETYRDQQDEIALVILDMAMPQMNGPETFRELRRIDPHAQVLISSGYFLDDRIEELLAECAIGFAQKPYTIDSLKAEIARARAQAGPQRWPEPVRPEDS
jgi:CheY-like chemotaxis protein